jgi:ligand-binding SRPBCC domain-containing protein
MTNNKIIIKKHAGIYTMVVDQELPLTLKKAWEFFSTPSNLAKITPPHMGFNITSKNTGNMYNGQIISYRIGIFPGINSHWITEITHIKKPLYFVDEQRFGPYKMWHHEHHFKETANGILMTDRVSYKIPFGFIGNIAHGIFVRKQLEKIFTYRYEKLNELFKTEKDDWNIQKKNRSRKTA